MNLQKALTLSKIKLFITKADEDSNKTSAKKCWSTNPETQ